MNLTLYAINVPELDAWWVQGYLAEMPCRIFFWHDEKKAQKHMENMDKFWGWTEQGYVPEVVPFNVAPRLLR